MKLMQLSLTVCDGTGDSNFISSCVESVVLLKLGSLYKFSFNCSPEVSLGSAWYKHIISQGHIRYIWSLWNKPLVWVLPLDLNSLFNSNVLISFWLFVESIKFCLLYASEQPFQIHLSIIWFWKIFLIPPTYFPQKWPECFIPFYYRIWNSIFIPLY